MLLFDANLKRGFILGLLQRFLHCRLFLRLFCLQNLSDYPSTIISIFLIGSEFRYKKGKALLEYMARTVKRA